jgi:hypothetical protein
MFSSGSIKKILDGFGTGLGAFLLPLLPYLPNKAFREWVLFGHGTGFLGGLSDNWIQSHVWFIILWTIFHVLLFFISHKWKFQDLWVAWLLILILFFVVNPFWEFYWLLWVLPFVALAVIINLNIWWLYLGTLVYYLFYIIVGWDFGIEIFMNGISNMSISGPRPRSVFFSSFDPMIKVTSIAYSFFAGLLIGIAVIVLLSVRDKYRLRNKEKLNIIERVSIIIIWGLYFIFLFWVGLDLGNVSMGDFIASYGATIGQDKYFFLIILCLVIILLGLLLKPKRLKRKQ